jgi:hypothetical protein
MSAELTDLERWGIEVRFSRTLVNGPRAFVLGVRLGGYEVRPTIGERAADSLGFEPGAEPSLTSVSIGRSNVSALRGRLGKDTRGLPAFLPTLAGSRVD